MSSYLLFGLKIYDLGSTYFQKLCKFVNDVYMVLTVKPEFVIGPSGQIILTNMISVADGTKIWHYMDDRLYRFADSRNKKLHIISCEFTCGEDTVSLDDFLENTKFADGQLSFPVLMAAFTIYSKKLYPWENAKFAAFTNDGDSVEFVGSDIKLVENIGKEKADYVEERI